MAENKGKQPHTPLRGLTIAQRSARKAKRHQKRMARIAARGAGGGPVVTRYPLKLTPSVAEQIIEWLLSDDCGSSSKTMVAGATGLRMKQEDRWPPLDSGDFGRCVRLLDKVPEIRRHFGRIAFANPAFAPIFREWDALEKLYRSGQFFAVYARLVALRTEAPCAE